ncbi:uncharacterized protein LOC124920379 isoform X2 [Impatiens glandulifera]|uniref:uncharacterized protein LOC124920379 isoform X2 n=1 Tax=Impatiens glandulifera TaxID=253017 RepID=UPI001FB07A1C|nr:uncharacterized protein LOC124920379 isoform X2 [Impatiens glandulifera]
MDQSWRARPPPQMSATVCPICSLGHFPFCPPIAFSNQNSMFHSHGVQPFQRPPYDPTQNHVRPPSFNTGGHGFSEPPPWQRNPSAEYMQYHVKSSNDLEGSTGFKRMRMNDIGTGSFTNECGDNSPRNERNLRLIRDHGSARDLSHEGLNGYGKNYCNMEGNDLRETEFDQGNYARKRKCYLNSYGEELGNSLYDQPQHLSHRANLQHPMEHRHDYDSPGHYGPTMVNRHDIRAPIHAGSINDHKYQNYAHLPPPPSSPPPPLPRAPLPDQHSKVPSHLFPVASVPASRSYAPNSNTPSLANPYCLNKPHQVVTGFSAGEPYTITRASNNSVGEVRHFPPIPLDVPKVIDASHIFKQPQRATRPSRFVIILRGLSGSGKSYLAKFLRDIEVENGGSAPRIHSMDDYFVTEVEKVDESEFTKSSGSSRGKKASMKVMEYCYEPEMEEAYRSSMLKAFKKTLEEGGFSFVIVDDRNLRVADFAQFWATAKRSGYEVYLLEATYKDPVGCAARSVHGFSQEDVRRMAGQWEEAPSYYLRLDIKVDMDTDDGDSSGPLTGSEANNSKQMELSTTEGSSNRNRKLEAGEGDQAKVKELQKSKWSEDLDEFDAKQIQATKGNIDIPSRLMRAYTKGSKSVHWGDQVAITGFSIGGMKRYNLSLVVGPGAGYNLKSNPLAEDHTATSNSSKVKRQQSVFQEQMRAERESFKAVFDKRRHRIGGLCVED